MIQNVMEPRLDELQHDWVTAHTARQSPRVLGQLFPGDLISSWRQPPGRRNHQIPPPANFSFPLGYLKAEFYKHQLRTMLVLRNAMRAEIAQIPPEMAFSRTRLQQCIDSEGHRLTELHSKTNLNFNFQPVGWRGGLAVRVLASHQGEPGPGPARPGHSGFAQVGVVTDYANGQRVFSGVSRFSRSCMPVLLHARPFHTRRPLKTSLAVAAAKLGHRTSLIFAVWKSSEGKFPAQGIAGVPKGVAFNQTANGEILYICVLYPVLLVIETSHDDPQNIPDGSQNALRIDKETAILNT
ncbi:hypothetical protein PR048_018535 [Dryococelus australis]|uniref:Uncharacterized protein n=1 Tax=Dryococelus australis TaxID=614101 RepID=A0ABQ9HCJ3_9NEOP|nr:hypothetical protein PR048_018535 [Dryococelus australis]